MRWEDLQRVESITLFPDFVAISARLGQTLRENFVTELDALAIIVAVWSGQSS